MEIATPSFGQTTLFGYDPDSVDRAVAWAMDRIRQDDPLEPSEINALRFPMARRNGYDPEEVDAWFGSLQAPVGAHEVHVHRVDVERPRHQPSPAPSPADPFPSAPMDPEPETPSELRGVSPEPIGDGGGHRPWVQLTALVLIVALLGLFIVSYFL